MVTSEFNPTISHPYFFIRKYLYKALAKHAGALTGKLMDFGCGSKPYKSLFGVDEYIGVDFHNEGHPHVNEQIDVFYDGKRLPFSDSYFDSVLCSEVFEHVFNLDEILKEINRVMKTEGKILITCPFVWNEHEVPFDFARYTRFALRDILERNGFEIIEFEKAGSFVPTVVQLWVLYFYRVFYKKCSRLFLTRWLYKLFFVAAPNFAGVCLAKLLPTESSLYLNNIVLAKKKAV